MLEHTISAMNGNKTINGNPVQILGIDVLIDKDLKAWALEVNASPSLNIYFEKEEYEVGVGKKQNDLGEDDICPVDLYVKSRVVTDAMNLARKKVTTLSGINEFGSLSRILPNEGDREAHKLTEAM
jgi:hypothetical protein